MHERLTRARATALGDVPGRAEAVSVDWLSAVLCADTPGASVTRFLVGPRDDGTTSRSAMVVDYNDVGQEAGLPTRLFVKCSATLLSRVLTGLSGAARAEVGFYSQLRPTMDIESPAAYHAAWQPGACRSAIVLEDVAVTGGVTFADPTETHVARSMVESQLDVIAGYHGWYWGSARLAGLPWLGTALQFQQTVNATIDFERRTMVGVERSEGIVPPELGRRRHEIYPKAMRSLELHAQAPVTLLHQDLHRNWYVTPEGRMGLFDWQCVAKGHWALDFAYTVSSALQVEDRRAWERELLGFYLDRLGAAGGQPPSFDVAWNHYRQQVFHALIFLLYTIGQGALQPDMQPRAVCEANVRRIAQAVTDLESLDAI